MSPYRRIVCPVDFSELSKKALRWSLEAAKRFDGALTVLHVLDTAAIRSETLFAAPESGDELRVRANEQFHALGREIDLSRARVETVEGAPSETIAWYARETKSDLVIMGTHGWSGVQRLLLGSVTEKVLHRIEVPLLTVTAEAAELSRVKTVLVALDLGDDSQAVMRHALWHAEASGARLVAAHIVPVPYVVLNDRTLERLSPSDYAELEKNLTEDRKAKIVDLLPESTSVEVDVVTKVGNVFDSLRELLTATHTKADLVVMGAGGHGQSALRWLGSTCHKMVRLGTCPVLIVR